MVVRIVELQFVRWLQSLPLDGKHCGKNLKWHRAKLALRETKSGPSGIGTGSAQVGLRLHHHSPSKLAEAYIIA
jgi:hypothetical protein